MTGHDEHLTGPSFLAEDQQADETKLISIPTAAALLGVGEQKLRALIRQGEIASVKMGVKTLVDEQSIRDMISRRIAEARIKAKQIRESRNNSK